MFTVKGESDPFFTGASPGRALSAAANARARLLARKLGGRLRLTLPLKVAKSTEFCLPPRQLLNV